MTPGCRIFHVPLGRSSGWKWRHVDSGGCIIECAEPYGGYFECVAAARASGYEPSSQWTGPLTVREPANT